MWMVSHEGTDRIWSHKGHFVAAVWQELIFWGHIFITSKDSFLNLTIYIYIFLEKVQAWKNPRKYYALLYTWSFSVIAVIKMYPAIFYAVAVLLTACTESLRLCFCHLFNDHAYSLASWTLCLNQGTFKKIFFFFSRIQICLT